MNRDFAVPSFIERLSDVDQLLCEPNCRIIKDQRKIKVGRLTLKIAGARRAVYIKRYNAFALRYRIASPFMTSGAFRALQGAAILRDAKLSTAPPVAAVEHRAWRALTKSFFISEEITGGKTADAYWREILAVLPGRDGFARRRDYLAALAGLFQTLHARGIYHNDLKDANILAVAKQPSVDFFLLDLEGVRRYPALSEKRRIKNLVQLHRTLGRYISRAGKLFFLRRYLGASFAEGAATRRLITIVLKESTRLDVLKSGGTEAKVSRIS